MPIDPDHLPSDVAVLQAMVAMQAAELVAARAGLIEQRHEIEALRSRLTRLLRTTFGHSSEKLQGQLEQLELLLADLNEHLAEAGDEQAGEIAAPTTGMPNKLARRPLPAALPRDVVEHVAPCSTTGACLTPPTGCCVRLARMSPRCWTTFRARFE